MVNTDMLVFTGFVLAVMAVIAGFLAVKMWLAPPPTQAAKQLHFAAVVLTGVGVVFLTSMGMYYFDSPTGTNAPSKEIFDTCVKVLPPIVTLVLGYYFGRREGESGEPEQASKPA